MTRNWIDDVRNTIPDYASNVADLLDLAMNNNPLNEVDAHACALAAACSTANGGLAFEISMNGPLFGREEREAAKYEAVNVALHAHYEIFSCAMIAAGPATVKYLDFPDQPAKEFPKVTDTQRAMYAFAAAVAGNKDECGYEDDINGVFPYGVTEEQAVAIAKIAVVIATIGKIVA